MYMEIPAESICIYISLACGPPFTKFSYANKIKTPIYIYIYMCVCVCVCVCLCVCVCAFVRVCSYARDWSIFNIKYDGKRAKNTPVAGTMISGAPVDDKKHVFSGSCR